MHDYFHQPKKHNSWKRHYFYHTKKNNAWENDYFHHYFFYNER